MHCRFCNHPIVDPPADGLCPKCQFKLEVPIGPVCACGTLNKAGARFCRACGKPLRAVPADLVADQSTAKPNARQLALMPVLPRLGDKHLAVPESSDASPRDFEAQITTPGPIPGGSSPPPLPTSRGGDTTVLDARQTRSVEAEIPQVEICPNRPSSRPWMRGIWAGLGGAVILLIIVLIRTKPTEKVPTTLPPPAAIKPTVVPPPSSHTPELTQPTGSLSPQVPRVTEPQSYPASETGLDDVIPLPSRSGASYNNEGLDLCKRHDFQGALEAFKCAVKLRPENPEYWNNVGYAYQELQRYETSNYFCFKALALSPNRTAAFGNIAYNHAKLRKEDEAVDYFTRYLRSFQSEAKRDRGVAFLRKIAATDQDPLVGICIRKAIVNLQIPN